MYKPLPLISEELHELQVRLKKERNAQRRQRLHLLVLIQSGSVATRQEAAEHLAVHRNSTGRWLSRYEQGGIEGLLAIEKTGAKPGQKSLSPAALAALEMRLHAEGFSSYGEATTWLAEEWGLEVPYKTVYGLLRYRLGAKLKRARPEHAKKTDPTFSPSPSA